MSSSPAANEYDALEVIGKGSYGTVRKVQEKSSGEIFVRKEIEYNSMNNQERNQLISELRILRELNHPNIVKYFRHDHIMQKKSIHIYMEYCDGGDLAQVISNFRKNKEMVPEEFIWQVLVQTLLALHRCHYGIDAKKVNLFSNPVDDKEPTIDSETVVIHRDIKPDNIFMLNSGKSIKLGDFGLAKMLTSQNDFAKTYVGTPYYMSPEVLMDNPYSPVCDIWSLGCVLFELCTLQPPFQAKTHLQLQSKIKQGIIPDLPGIYSSQLRSIIKECITVDPELRPSCYDLLETLSIRFLRKEMELKEINTNLNEFQKQLLTKNDELKKKESLLNNIERKIFAQREDLENEYNNMQKKCNSQKKQLEEELIEEFEMRKKSMDQEAKEVRLGYQREFKMVVEHEVQLRLKDILGKQKHQQQQQQQQQHLQQHQQQHQHQNQHQHPQYQQPQPYQELSRKKSDPLSSPSPSKATTRNTLYLANHYAAPNEHVVLPNKPKGPKELQLDDQSKLLSPQLTRRIPLKTRNSENSDYDSNGYYSDQYKSSPTRFLGNNYKKRVTDELERLSLEKRNIPEFEELYIRKNRH
jgi:NIMA (never in mitosis gene a)-related kinase